MKMRICWLLIKHRGWLFTLLHCHSTSTLVNGLLAHCKDSLSGIEESRPIVHRLDKDTQGLMVVAKNDETHQSLSQQFQPKILSTDKETNLKTDILGLCLGQAFCLKNR